jgi:hypothetical protein
MAKDLGEALLLSHLRAALINALIILAIGFSQGVITGWGIHYFQTRLLLGLPLAIGPLLVTAYAGWVYYRTNGLLHHSGFRRALRTPGASADEP